MSDQTNKTDVSALWGLIEKQQKQIEKLIKVADKSKLARLDENEPKGTIIRVSTYAEKSTDKPLIVSSWRTIKDEVYPSESGWIEDQVVEITLENDSVKELGYKDFVRRLKTISVEVDSTRVRKGVTYYCFKHNDKDYEINELYIN